MMRGCKTKPTHSSVSVIKREIATLNFIARLCSTRQFLNDDGDDDRRAIVASNRLVKFWDFFKLFPATLIITTRSNSNQNND